MSEFEELAHQITDDIRTNRPVAPDFIEIWHDHGDQAHICSVCAAFPLPIDPAARAQEVLGLEDQLGSITILIKPKWRWKPAR